MNSKAFIIVSFCALVFLISSAVSIENSKGEETNQVGDEKRYCGGSGCCYYGGYGQCLRCCKDAEEAHLMANEAKPQKMNKAEESNPVKEEKHGGWGGGYGGGGHGGGGHGGGGHGGGGHGGGGHGGGGKCCGKDKMSEAKP